MTHEYLNMNTRLGSVKLGEVRVRVRVRGSFDGVEGSVFIHRRGSWSSKFCIGGRWPMTFRSDCILSHVCVVCCWRGLSIQKDFVGHLFWVRCDHLLFVVLRLTLMYVLCLVESSLRRDVVCVVVVACSCVYLGPITLDTANSNTLTVSLSSFYVHQCLSWSGWCDRYSN